MYNFDCDRVFCTWLWTKKALIIQHAIGHTCFILTCRSFVGWYLSGDCATMNRRHKRHETLKAIELKDAKGLSYLRADCTAMYCLCRKQSEASCVQKSRRYMAILINTQNHIILQRLQVMSTWHDGQEDNLSQLGKISILFHWYIVWLVVWNMFYFLFHIWDVILPIDFHIFQRGRSTTNQVNYHLPWKITIFNG
jgi:hypothetical protein